MLGWIPFIGPIIDGIVSMFNKSKDVELGKYTVDGKVDIEALKASVGIAQATKDDIGLRILRDIAVTPAVIWIGLISWDTIVALNHPQWMFHIEKFPDSVAYYPGMALGFLLCNMGINVWRGK